MRRPSGLNRALLTVEVWACRAMICTPVEASHTLAVLSPPAVTIRRPSGLHDAWLNPSVWPLRVSTRAPVEASHTFAVLSIKAASTRLPSGLHATPATPPHLAQGAGAPVPL